MFKKIYIEVTNACNLNCSFCIGNNREKKYISIKDFIILLSKLEGYTKYLYFHVMGEPLLHPRINELIDIASKKFYINITTNGYLINKIKDNKNIRQINISLHSFNLKYGKSFEDYISDIFSSVDILSSNGTIVNYRLWVNSEYKDKIIDLLNRKYTTTIGDGTNVKLDHNIYFEVESEFVWPSFSNEYYSLNGSCRATRDHLGILVDGTIVPCCLDSQGIIKLGNIYKQELNDIINSELFKEMKKGFEKNIKFHPLCKKCNFYESRR